MKKRSLWLFSLLLLAACTDSENEEDMAPIVDKVPYTPTLLYTVTDRFPHDKNAFIEGFVMHEGKLFESTGSPHDMPDTRSIIGTLDRTSGKIQRKIEIDKKYFGEGMVILKGKIYQLTYQAKVGFIYDAATYKKLGEFKFQSNEGWGLTTDGTHLIMSDGTHVLTYINPDNFSVVKTLQVTNEYGFVPNINELEFVKGFIFANLYTTNSIVKIDASSGKVVGKLDCTSIANEAHTKHSGSLEMNGIAYDESKDAFLLTGKMWPTVFEIKLN